MDKWTECVKMVKKCLLLGTKNALKSMVKPSKTKVDKKSGQIVWIRRQCTLYLLNNFKTTKYERPRKRIEKKESY